MQKAMNQQINAETYSAYLYMAMGAWFESIQLPGFAHWMMLQAQEELTHSLRFYQHLVERGGRATMLPIEGPPNEWDSAQACFEAVAEHERKVTGLINDLVTLARSENDYASENFLQWFVKEQVEEEASVDEILGKLKLVKQTEGGLFMLDKEMAARVFTMPADLAV
jgi:ferritin